MSSPVSGEQHERAVEAVTLHLQAEWAGPYMARIRDFTEGQIEVGELRAADNQAHEEAKSEARRALDAYFASLAEQGVRLVDLRKVVEFVATLKHPDLPLEWSSWWADALESRFGSVSE